MLPAFLKRYFWDTDMKGLDKDEHAQYIIERILEHGDTDALQWMTRSYSRESIIEVLKHSRSLSRKRAHLWALFFEVPEADVECLSKQFQNRSRAIWNR